MQNASSQRLLAGALLLSAALAVAWWLLPITGRFRVEREPLEPLGGPWSGDVLPASKASAASLHRTPWAEISISPTNLAAGHPAAQTYDYEIVDFEVQTSKDKRPSNVWSAKLPFALPNWKGPPKGVVVTLGDDPLTYPKNPDAPLIEGEWRVHDGTLLVASEARPEKAVVTVTPERGQMDRLDRSLFKGDDAAFAHHALTLGQKSHEGLLLPAPSSATWSVTVPADGRFRAALAMAPSGADPGDGAQVVLEVSEAGGQPAEVARASVPAATDAFEAFEASLSKWAGAKIALTLRTESGATNLDDYLFVGAPAVTGRPSGDVRRIIVIGMDTTRPDHFGLHGYPKQTTPELDAFGRQSVVFDNAFAPAPRTRPSFRTATTGRWPLEAVGAKNIGQTFAENGFATAGIVSNVHLTPAFDFSNGFDFWWLDGKAKASDEVDRALAWLKSTEDRDSYLFLHIMDPHISYRAPEAFNAPFIADLAKGPDPDLPKMFNRWEVYRWMNQGKLTDQRKEHIHALYEGEYAYTSREMDRLFQAVDAMPGKTLIVIHSDHGEEMFEHGGFEHNHTLYQEVVRALLWVRPPGGVAGGYRVQIPVSLADIAPTLYEFAGISGPESDGHSLLPLMRGDTTAEQWGRPLPTGYLQYDRERWGVIWQGKKYILTTGDGAEELYDLTADPHERENLAGDVDLQPWREQLAAAHTVPVGPGYRIEVSLAGSAPVTVRLPEKALAADVLDPESIVKNRANLELGEKPEKTVADVGSVVLADDGLSFTFTPGRVGEGTLYVLFEGTEAPTGLTATRDDEAVGGSEQPWSDGEARIHFQAGTIVVPPSGEHVRIEQSHGSATAGKGSDEEMRQLEALGYVGGGRGDEARDPNQGDEDDH